MGSKNCFQFSDVSYLYVLCFMSYVCLMWCPCLVLCCVYECQWECSVCLVFFCLLHLCNWASIKAVCPNNISSLSLLCSCYGCLIGSYLVRGVKRHGWHFLLLQPDSRRSGESPSLIGQLQPPGHPAQSSVNPHVNSCSFPLKIIHSFILVSPSFPPM